MRLVWIFVALTALLLLPFLVWGESLGRSFSQEGARDWLQGHGHWAWAAGILLLTSDLLLPMPATAVMAGLGFLYGPLGGGLIGGAGSFLAGFIAYELCRGLGRSAALRLVGASDLAKGEALFSRAGGWLVAVSRWLPLFPEIIACLAGLTRMPRSTFTAALACGSWPMGLVYATIGHAGVARPGLALALSALLPPLLWFLIHRHLHQRGGATAAPRTGASDEVSRTDGETPPRQ